MVVAGVVTGAAVVVVGVRRLVGLFATADGASVCSLACSAADPVMGADGVERPGVDRGQKQRHADDQAPAGEPRASGALHRRIGRLVDYSLAARRQRPHRETVPLEALPRDGPCCAPIRPLLPVDGPLVLPAIGSFLPSSLLSSFMLLHLSPLRLLACSFVVGSFVRSVHWCTDPRWVAQNNCIGQNNHVYFVSFLTATLPISASWVMLGWAYLRVLHPEGNYRSVISDYRLLSFWPALCPAAALAVQVSEGS